MACKTLYKTILNNLKKLRHHSDKKIHYNLELPKEKDADVNILMWFLAELLERIHCSKRFQKNSKVFQNTIRKQQYKFYE